MCSPVKDQDQEQMEMQVFMKDTRGRCSPITVKPTDSICVPDSENLFLLVNNKVIQSGSTFGECGIKDQDTIVQCEQGCFRLTVEASAYCNFRIEVESTDTVRTLKAKLHEESGIPQEKLHMYCGGRLLDNDKTCLGAYGYTVGGHRRRIVLDPDQVEEFIELYTTNEDCMEPRRVFTPVPFPGMMQIFVEIATKNYYIPFKGKPMDTVEAVKTMILQYHFRSGQHELMFGKKLLDGNSTLKECGIKNLDCISLCNMETFPIHIYSPTRYFELSEYLNIEVGCLDTIGSVKVKIEEHTGIPPAEQHLRYLGWWLADDEKSLIDYGIMKSDSGLLYNILLVPPLEAGLLPFSDYSDYSLLPPLPPGVFPSSGIGWLGE